MGETVDDDRIETDNWAIIIIVNLALNNLGYTASSVV